MANRRLSLHSSALTDDEYDQYSVILNDLCPDGEDVLSVRETRAWLRGRYPDSPVDDILKLFAPAMKVTDTITIGQFYAAMRLLAYAHDGHGVDRSLAFTQRTGECVEIRSWKLMSLSSTHCSPSFSNYKPYSWSVLVFRLTRSADGRYRSNAKYAPGSSMVLFSDNGCSASHSPQICHKSLRTAASQYEPVRITLSTNISHASHQAAVLAAVAVAEAASAPSIATTTAEERDHCPASSSPSRLDLAIQTGCTHSPAAQGISADSACAPTAPATTCATTEAKDAYDATNAAELTGKQGRARHETGGTITWEDAGYGGPQVIQCTTQWPNSLVQDELRV